MRKFFLPFIAVTLFAALLSAPALAQPTAAAAPAPLPAGTASPRDWNEYAPEGSLLPDKIKGDSAILIDANTGKVLFEKNADDKRYPASTTKIMTCLLALESGTNLGGIVKIGNLPKTDFINDAENIGLKNGEKIIFKDLLAGMMVYSGNDAADAVAIAVGGSIDHFVGMMNQKAQELGMTGTHYTCTNGLSDDTDHYTTPRDMATLAMAAEKYPEFVKLVSYSKYKMSPTNKHPSPTAWTTTNHLLLDDQYGYQYATGIKTGYTGMAQSSLVSSAKKSGMSLIAVDMHVENRPDMWTDSVTMFEYGFQYYDTVDLKKLLTDRTYPMAVKGAESADPGNGSLDLILKPQGQAFITDSRDVIQKLKGDPSQLQQVAAITKDTAPIASGETVGTVTYYYGGNPVLTCSLVASRNVNAMATPAPSDSPALSASPAPTGKAASSTPAPANPSVTGGAASRKSGGAFPAVIWIAAAVLLIALAIVAMRLWNMRRRSRRTRRYVYRQGNNAKLRR